MKKNVLIIFITLILMFTIIILLIPNNPKENFTTGVSVVPTMDDIISNDSSWCGTFQLVWNDMKNEVVKKDIVFNPQITMATNLNKETFNETMLSSDSYYKVYGLKTKELKKEIEKNILEKFNQKSDILNDFGWDEDSLDNNNFQRYFFYVMLYKEFEFPKEFTKLTGNFKDKNVDFFGIDNNTNEDVNNQITVLFYEDDDNFAISIQTKGNDEIILYKNPLGNTFNEIYTNLENKTNNYKGNNTFYESDTFKMPIINFNVKREYSELTNKKFSTFDNNEAEIMQAIQTIKFSINEKGGKVKSEAAIDIKNSLVTINKERKFYLDNTFTLFLKEKEQLKPYLALKIDNIDKYI